jgi:hypothetical protein
MVRSLAMSVRTAGPPLGLLFTVGLGLCACGPIEYISIVTFEASKSVAAARGARAAELAPYEYTAAVEYLHKARELGGHARYQQAVDYGRRARDLGRQAFELSRGKADRPVEVKQE